MNLEMSSNTTSPSTFAEDCRKRFLLADADMSGTLDKTEVRTLVRALGFGLISDEYLAGCWDVFDANGDGVLDLQEVQEMVQVLLAEGTQGMNLKSKVHGKAEKAKNAKKAKAEKAEAGKAEAEPPGAAA